MVSKKELSKRKFANMPVLFRPGPEIPERNSHHILLVKAITGPDLRDRKQTPPLDGEVARDYREVRNWQ